MKYNSMYDRYVTKGGLVYRYSKAQDKLVLCKLTPSIGGYARVSVTLPITKVYVHRLVYETFIGEIPQGYEIDHINTIRDDNRLENLKLVTPKENMNNPLTLKHFSELRKGKTLTVEHKRKISESLKGNTYAKGNTNTKGKTRSEFGRKFKEHYGITKWENPTLYERERMWYHSHNKTCRWEVENG